MDILPLSDDYRPQVAAAITAAWGGTQSVSRYKLTDDVSLLPGFVALQGGEMLGFVLYQVEGAECEVTSLISLREGAGAGTALMRAAEDAARAAGCKSLWLGTSNDNAHAMRFYQKLGYHIAAARLGAMAEYRKIKPSLPLTGHDGIPMRDEIEFAKEL